MYSVELNEEHYPSGTIKQVHCAACKKEMVWDWTVKTVQDSEGSLLHYHVGCETQGPKVLA